MMDFIFMWAIIAVFISIVLVIRADPKRDRDPCEVYKELLEVEVCKEYVINKLVVFIITPLILASYVVEMIFKGLRE